MNVTHPPAAAAVRMELRDIRKSYGSNDVLKGVNLHIEAGQIHALLGANGAGKSTLLACLSGAEHPDSGELIVNGVSHSGFTPRGAFDAGTSIIYQHFQLAGELSVADNIFLGSEHRTRMGTLDRAFQVAETRKLLESLDVAIDPTAIVDTLSVGEQQIVEIARALNRNPQVLILDEPTAALGTHEVDALLALIRRLTTEQGIAIIYVTHLLGEVFEIADRITVLRDGQVLFSSSVSELGVDDLVHAISPDSVDAAQKLRGPFNDVLLETRELSCSYTGPVSLNIHQGEIVGLFGLLGSGRTNLLETLAGVRKPRSGAVLLDGDPVHCTSPSAALRAGFALVASDRKEQSLFGEMSALENVLMPHFGSLARLTRRMTEERDAFDAIAESVNLKPLNRWLEADGFSGGNAQKLAVGRWAGGLGNTRILLLDEPTQGVDIGSRHELYELIREFAARPGCAVLFASSDPDEMVALADRVAVLVDGAVSDIVKPEVGEEALLALAQNVAIRSERTES